MWKVSIDKHALELSSDSVVGEHIFQFIFSIFGPTALLVLVDGYW